jgi:hypothetical protein
MSNVRRARYDPSIKELQTIRALQLEGWSLEIIAQSLGCFRSDLDLFLWRMIAR